jgi:hypothetical protein
MDGSHPVEFRLFDAQVDGNLFWMEADTITVESYLFTATLGRNAPLPVSLFSGQTYWLETTIEGATLSPRLAVSPSMYSFRSQRADTADVALASPPSTELWSTDGTNVWRSGGMVGIGVAPSASLTIDALTGGSSGRARLFYDSSIYPGIYGEIYHNGDQSGLTLQSRGSAIGSGDISFWTGQTTPDERMRIHHDGGVSMPNTLTTGALATTSLNAYAIGIGPGTPWGTYPGICMDAGSQQSYLQWNDRSSCGFLMFQPQGSNQFNFNSTGGGSWETWRWVSAGLGELFVIGPTITSNRNVQINGTLNVSGALNVAGTKCRVVETDHHGKLKVNATESGHALFMDDGHTARLTNGQCRVNLNTKFLETVTVDRDHPLIVNVTFYGPHGDSWYVKRDNTGFTVVDPSGSNAEFSWEVKARQKNYEDIYLAPVEVLTANRSGGRP